MVNRMNLTYKEAVVYFSHIKSVNLLIKIANAMSLRYSTAD